MPEHRPTSLPPHPWHRRPSPRGRRRRGRIALGVVAFLLTAFLIGAAFIPLPYYLFKPGSVRDTEPLISVSGAEVYPSDGSIGYTTVSLRQATLLGLAQGWVDDDIDVVPRDDVLQRPRRGREPRAQPADDDRLQAGGDVRRPRTARLRRVDDRGPGRPRRRARLAGRRRDRARRRDHRHRRRAVRRPRRPDPPPRGRGTRRRGDGDAADRPGARTRTSSWPWWRRPTTRRGRSWASRSSPSPWTSTSRSRSRSTPATWAGRRPGSPSRSPSSTT